MDELSVPWPWFVCTEGMYVSARYGIFTRYELHLFITFRTSRAWYTTSTTIEATGNPLKALLDVKNYGMPSALWGWQMTSHIKCFHAAMNAPCADNCKVGSLSSLRIRPIKSTRTRTDLEKSKILIFINLTWKAQLFHSFSLKRFSLSFPMFNRAMW